MLKIQYAVVRAEHNGAGPATKAPMRGPSHRITRPIPFFLICPRTNCTARTLAPSSSVRFQTRAPPHDCLLPSSRRPEPETTMAGGKIQKKRQAATAAAQGPVREVQRPAYPEKLDAGGLHPRRGRPQAATGTGNLSNRLLEAGGKVVIAVKLDPGMVLELSRWFHGPALSSHLKVQALSFLAPNAF